MSHAELLEHARSNDEVTRRLYNVLRTLRERRRATEIERTPADEEEIDTLGDIALENAQRLYEKSGKLVTAIEHGDETRPPRFLSSLSQSS